LSIQAGCSFGTDHFKTTKMTLKSPVVNVVSENDQKAAEQELERLRDEQQQQAV
jgi:hypothetical protein